MQRLRLDANWGLFAEISEVDVVLSTTPLNLSPGRERVIYSERATNGHAPL